MCCSVDWLIENASTVWPVINFDRSVGWLIDWLMDHKRIVNCYCPSIDWELFYLLIEIHDETVPVSGFTARQNFSSPRIIYQHILFLQLKQHFTDRVLECEYPAPITSFFHDVPRQSPFLIPVLEEGRSALDSANVQLSRWLILALRAKT